MHHLIHADLDVDAIVMFSPPPRGVDDRISGWYICSLDTHSKWWVVSECQESRSILTKFSNFVESLAGPHMMK